jgi:dihydrofolate reductase
VQPGHRGRRSTDPRGNVPPARHGQGSIGPNDPSIGSLTLARSLLHLGLVDRLRLTIFPLLLGDAGREPFYPGHPRSGLELIGTRVLDSRVVMLEYRPAPGGAS